MLVVVIYIKVIYILYKSKSGLPRLLLIDLNKCESLKEIKELIEKRKSVTSIVSISKKKKKIIKSSANLYTRIMQPANN